MLTDAEIRALEREAAWSAHADAVVQSRPTPPPATPSPAAPPVPNLELLIESGMWFI